MKELSGKVWRMCLRIVFDVEVMVLWRSLNLDRWIRIEGLMWSSS